MFPSMKRAQVLASSLLPFHFSSQSSVQTTTFPEPSQSTPPQPAPKPVLTLSWPDGLRDNQELPQTGEVTIGNIAIRRARVRYYLERIDNAFPALLNGQSIGKAHMLNDGDVLQIGELQTVFQISA